MIRFATIFAGALVAGSLSTAVFAQSPSQLEQQINNSLQSAPKPALTRSLNGGATRSIAVDPTTPQQKNLVNTLRTRSIAVEPTNAPAAVEQRNEIQKVLVEAKPKIDLEIYFDYNSAEIGPKAVPALIALGNVLSKGDFKGGVFLINGHTDGKGSPHYNLALSQRRALAVKQFLVEQYKLPHDTLIAVGFGFEQLKIKENPFADVNRRVQIVNTEVNAQAGR